MRHPDRAWPVLKAPDVLSQVPDASPPSSWLFLRSCGQGFQAVGMLLRGLPYVH